MKFIVIVLIFSLRLAYSQCSDAGVCSLGDAASKQLNDQYTFGIDYRFGYSGMDDEINYHSVIIKGSARIFDQTTIHFSIPAMNFQDGPAGNTSGLGDLILLLQQQIYSKDNLSFSINFGHKFATGSDNEKDLPMAYQPGLGTNDYLAGVSVGFDKLLFVVAYQLVENKFNSNNVPLKRADDLFARIAYRFDWRGLNWEPELQIIKRLEKSEIKTENGTETVADSDPLQVNIGLAASYSLSEKAALNTKVALATIERENNIDGLTRALTFQTGIKFSF